ncbi:MAG: methylmalonyl Co-A mutase-associated GTPase MeaB [Pseudomonadota bacterium]
MADQELDSIVQRICGGDRRLAARLMRDVDDGIPSSREVLAALYPRTGRAHILGVTGNPGAGKSTLVNRLIRIYREQGYRVGVVAIDPTSPFTGGAILGDRIRMQDHATDPGVFIRSVATRGHLGGLSRSTDDIVTILDAMGHDLVIIETVGVGQDEIDVVRTAHTSLVVLVPGLGDEVQALKAGILEIADLFVINKADREGADRTSQEIRMMLALGDVHLTSRGAALDAAVHHDAPVAVAADNADGRTGWAVPVLKAVATKGQGLYELQQEILGHWEWLEQSGTLLQRRRQRERERLHRLTRDAIWAEALRRLGGEQALDVVVEEVLQQRTDPYTASERLRKQILAPGR